MAVAYLLDTNAVLYLLRGELANPLPRGTYYLSVISEMELLSYGDITDAEQVAIQEFLDSVCVVELSGEVRRLAIQLRRRMDSSCRMPLLRPPHSQRVFRCSRMIRN